MTFDAPEAAVLRALGNPVRRAILDRLGHGRSTGAELARGLDSNTGVVSYHLRELAKVGLVELDETRGRAQFWRLSEVDLRFRDPRQSTDPEAAQSIVDARLSGLATAVDHYVARTDLEPAWRQAALFSESSLELTADELAAFTSSYLELLGRWSSNRPPARPGSRAVRLDLFAFPTTTDGTDQ
ncbi:MAG: ArsR/SmtB family transcription factor [Sciscionella sp.]